MVRKGTKETNLQVTFSKRRSGLFKKANEISTLCGAEVALIVFSPGEKVFSFGHPNINVLLDRFSRCHRNYIPRRISDAELVESNTNSYIQDLNEMFTQVVAEKELERKKKYASIINKRLTENPDNWFEKPPKELNLFEAIQMTHVVEDLKRQVDDLLSQTPPNYYVGSSSNVAPSGTFHDGNNIYTNKDLNISYSNVSQNIFHDGNIYTNQDFNVYDPNMVTLNHMMSFGYNHANNNISEILVSDFVMNPTDHNQISINEFKQSHPHYRPH